MKNNKKENLKEDENFEGLFVCLNCDERIKNYQAKPVTRNESDLPILEF